MWPGNTADVASLIPVATWLKERFGIGRICIVADRGMISDATIAALEAMKWEYPRRAHAQVQGCLDRDPRPCRSL